MNKRIRELAEQAGEYVNEVYTPPVRSKTPGKIWEDGHVDWHEQFNQKFAELIVRECLSIIDRRKRWIDNENGNTDNLWTHGYEKAINHCSMFIKEYFGVEEK